MAWKDSTTPLSLPVGEKHHKPMTIMAEPNGGSVQVQFRNSSGAWVTPSVAEYTLTQFGPARIERANTPQMRIIATGGARFEVTFDT